MYRDYIIKQTSPFDSEFKAKTLVGNWYEERCDPRNDYGNFYKERKFEEGPYLHEEKFMNSSANWSSFQKYQPQSTFNTEYKDNFKNAEEQKRLSVLRPFITRKSQFQTNQESLQKYRETWTKSDHLYDSSRTYLGAEQSDQAL